MGSSTFVAVFMRNHIVFIVNKRSKIQTILLVVQTAYSAVVKSVELASF